MEMLSLHAHRPDILDVCNDCSSRLRDNVHVVKSNHSADLTLYTSMNTRVHIYVVANMEPVIGGP